MQVYLIVFYLVLFVQIVRGGRFNVSYEELDQCKEYDSLSGYNYHTYFKIDDIHGANSGNTIVNIKLFILAAKDAHILLSPTKSPTYNSAVYEIVLGAGGNTFAEVRRRRQSQPLKTIRTRKLLSAIDPLPIRLRMDTDGTIDVSVPGSDVLNLTVKDSAPFAVHYISFSTWGTTEGKFFYDCQTNDKTEENMLDILMPQLPLSEQLRTGLLSFYDFRTMPPDLEEVALGVDILRVSYDYKKSDLTTRAIFRANWTDSKLKWNPDDYGGIHGLHISSNNFESKMLWKPEFKLLNGQGSFFRELKIEFTLFIYSTGLVTTESKSFHFNTWCAASDPKWPHDTVDCEILLGLQNMTIKPVVSQQLESVNSQLTIRVSNDIGYLLRTHVPNRPQSIDFENMHHSLSQNGEEWHLHDVGVIDSSASNQSRRKEVEIAASHVGFKLQLKRDTYFYSTVLTSPLFAAISILILSLFSNGYTKTTLNLLSILILYVMFIFLAEHAPVGFVPKIALFYDFTFILATITLFANVYRLQQTTNAAEQKCCQFLGLIQLPWLRLILFMDGWEINDIASYEKVTEPPSSANFAVLIDRIVFITLIVTIFLITFSCHL